MTAVPGVFREPKYFLISLGAAALVSLERIVLIKSSLKDCGASLTDSEEFKMDLNNS
jgi:hypothetical protein